jgi:hypothetical protein
VGTEVGVVSPPHGAVPPGVVPPVLGVGVSSSVASFPRGVEEWLCTGPRERTTGIAECRAATAARARITRPEATVVE